MGVLTIRNISDELKLGLRLRAALHGHSMAEEVRQILASAIADPHSDIQLGTRLHQRFAGLVGIQISRRRSARVDAFLGKKSA